MQYYIKTSSGYTKVYLRDNQITINKFGHKFHNGNKLYNDWHRLTIDQKIKIKQHAINKHGKRTHYNRPDAFKDLTETQLYYLLATKN